MKTMRNAMILVGFVFGVLTVGLIGMNGEGPVRAEAAKTTFFGRTGTRSDSEEEEYVFDEEYWENCMFDDVPRTLEEENEFWRDAFLNYGRKYIGENGTYYYEFISWEEKTIRILHIRDAEGEVRIPEEIEGNRVTEIGLERERFVDLEYDLESYESVFLPSTCDKITSLMIPEGVEYIGYQAFSYCRNLESVQLPSTLKQMETCFEYCESLEELVLPADMQYARLEKIPLKKLTLSGSVESLVLDGGFLTEFEVPPGMKHLQIYDMPLERIYIPDSIEKLVLNNMPQLESVEIEGNGSQFNAFHLSEAPKLKEIPLTGPCPYLERSMDGSDSRLDWLTAYYMNEEGDLDENYPYSAYAVRWVMDGPTGFSCFATGVERLIVPQGIRRIGTQDIAGNCVNLKEVILPYSVSEVVFDDFLNQEDPIPYRLVVPNPNCEYTLAGRSHFDLVTMTDYFLERPNIRRITLVLPVNSKMEGAQRHGAMIEVLSRTGEEGRREICYMAEKGDTLWEISREYNTTVEAIASLNQISNPNLIHVGQILWVPAAE